MHFLSSIFIRPVQSISINFGTFRGFIRFVLTEIDYMFRFNSYDSELRPSSPRRYVFVCLGNINRSAFADVVAQSKGLIQFLLASPRRQEHLLPKRRSRLETSMESIYETIERRILRLQVL